METVELPEGGWAKLRSFEELSVKQQRLIQKVGLQMGSFFRKVAAAEAAQGDNTAEALDLNEREAELTFELNDASIVARLAMWSLPDKLPSLETVTDLPRPVYDALSIAVRDLNSKEAEPDFPQAAEGETEQPQSPEPPTPSSSSSEPDLTGSRTVLHLPQKSSPGSSTSIESSSSASSSP